MLNLSASNAAFVSNFVLQIRPNVFWKENARDLYLDEIVRSEGQGDFARDSQCPDCILRGKKDVGLAEFRC